MTDVLERAVRPDLADGVPAEPARSAASTCPVLAWPGRVLLAALAGAAGVVHLAMVPSHMDASTAEGLAFAAAGWTQVVSALLLVARPTRAVLRFVTASTTVFLGAWVVSRTLGLPFGEHPGHPADAEFVDSATVGIEAALLVLAGGLLTRPARAPEPPASAPRRPAPLAGTLVGVVAPLAVVALATAALASPSARDHAAGSHGDHSDAAAAGHGHGVGTAAAADDKGLSKLENGHQHGSGEVKLDPATQAALTQQLNQTRALIAKYPTIAAAEAAGYRRAGPFSPGLGTHYIGLGNRDMADDVLQGVDGPMFPSLIYDGTDPDSPIAGFMYLSLKAGQPPEGFVGPNDHWHYHTNTCVVYRNGVIEAPLGADRNVTLDQCRAVGGRLIPVTTYMIHVWTVPGYESPRGVFSEVNPKLTCPDGTYYTVPASKIGFRLNACRRA